MMMYGIVGAVLVVVTMVVINVINKPVVDPNLSKPKTFDPDQFGPDPEEVARQEKEAAEKAAAAAAAADPKTFVNANITRMIQLARSAQLRDEALARQMTGDSYLRMDDSKKASFEFDQMIRNDRKGAVYRIEPNLAAYWRFVAAGDAANAKKYLDLALADINSVPASGRLGTEVTLSLASVMMNEGQAEQALQNVNSRQQDQTNPGFRDQLHSISWQFVASRSRDLRVAAPSAFESLLWADPLVTAVAANLAMRGRWDQAIGWASQQTDSRVASDCLVVVSDIAALKSAPADVFSKIDAAAPGNNPLSLRVKAAVAAAAKDKARLDAPSPP